jgi:hypothetical protein
MQSLRFRNEAVAEDLTPCGNTIVTVGQTTGNTASLW